MISVISLEKVVHVAFDSVAYRRKYYLEHKEKEVAYSTKLNRLKRTGVTEQQYNDKFNEQAGLCAICLGTCTKQLAADHCHETGTFRGLLCNNCNRGLGHFKDSMELLTKARKYLELNQIVSPCDISGHGGSCGV